MITDPWPLPPNHGLNAFADTCHHPVPGAPMQAPRPCGRRRELLGDIYACPVCDGVNGWENFSTTVPCKHTDRKCKR